MHLCRLAWHSLASRLPRAAPLLRAPGNGRKWCALCFLQQEDGGFTAPSSACLHRIPFRQMSSGSVPGSSGENLIYYLLVAGATGAGGYYAYRTVTSDKARYNERIEDIQQRTTAEWKPKPWPPQSSESDETESNEVAEGSEEAKTTATEQTEAGESEAQTERQTETTEAEKGEPSPVVEASLDVQEEKQEDPSSSETAQTKD